MSPIEVDERVNTVLRSLRDHGQVNKAIAYLADAQEVFKVITKTSETYLFKKANNSKICYLICDLADREKFNLLISLIQKCCLSINEVPEEVILWKPGPMEVGTTAMVLVDIPILKDIVILVFPFSNVGIDLGSQKAA